MSNRDDSYMDDKNMQILTTFKCLYNSIEAHLAYLDLDFNLFAAYTFFWKYV